MVKKRKKIQTVQEQNPVQPVEVNIEAWHVRIVSGFCLLGFAIYANTLTASFHFDDFATIINNPAVRNFWDWQGLFNAFNTRFLTGWTFAVNYFFGKLNVTGYHFLNIWLHICNSVLIYTLVSQLLELDKRVIRSSPLKINIAFASSLIFLVHPLATQPVNYIWQRSTLLAAFFVLGSLVLYLHSRMTQSKWFYWAAWVAGLMAMFSKENAFILPVIICVLECIFFGFKCLTDAKTWLRWTPFLLLPALIFILLQRSPFLNLELMRTFDATRGVADELMPRQEYLLTQVNVLRTYLRLFVIPVGQNVDHDYPLAAQTGWGVWICSFGLLASLGVSAGYSLKKNKLYSLGILWFFVTSALECFVTSNDLCAEHRMYLPMVGLCVAGSSVIYELFKGHRLKMGLCLTLACALIFSFLTVHRNKVWKDDLTLWSDAVEKSPNKARPVNNRGQVLRKTGYPELALNDFNRAIALDSKYWPAYINRAHLYKSKGNLDLALKDYTVALSRDPRNADVYASRGSVYRRKGDSEAAIKDYTKAIEYDSSNPEYFSNRAYLYQNLGRNQQAVDDYTMALAVQPDYVYALNNRGNLYLNLGKVQEALNDYNRSITVDPQFGEAYMNRAVAYFQLNRLAESKADMDSARRLGVVPNSEFARTLKAALQGKNIRKRP